MFSRLSFYFHPRTFYFHYPTPIFLPLCSHPPPNLYIQFFHHLDLSFFPLPFIANVSHSLTPSFSHVYRPVPFSPCFTFLTHIGPSSLIIFYFLPLLRPSLSSLFPSSLFLTLSLHLSLIPAFQSTFHISSSFAIHSITPCYFPFLNTLSLSYSSISSIIYLPFISLVYSSPLWCYDCPPLSSLSSSIPYVVTAPSFCLQPPFSLLLILFDRYILPLFHLPFRLFFFSSCIP